MKRFLLTIMMAFAFLSCSEKPPEEVRIGINPWPGYDYLYLAEQKGFFKEAGLNVRIVQYSSLADVQRAFIQGQINGMGSTLIELIQARRASGVDARAVLVSDYSHGADLIIAKPGIENILDLKGKRIGLELHSLGIFMLSRALERSDLSLKDVDPFHVEQLDLLEAFRSDKVQAAVTYPPTSTKILNEIGGKVIFTSGEIPAEIVDVISFKTDLIQQQPDLVEKLRKIWDQTLDFAKEYEEEAFKIMADREQLTVAEFKEVLSGMIILNTTDQKQLWEPGGSLESSFLSAEKALREVGLISDEKKTIQYVYRK